MNRAYDEREPEDVDAMFSAIVADLQAEGLGNAVEEPGENTAKESKDPPAEQQDTGASWRTGGTGWDDTVLGDDPAPDEEHYVPPEPPPLPRPGKGAFVVLLFFLIGLLLLIAPGLIGMGTTLATPLGILALATAIALLLLRVKQGPPDGADPSNGAQV